MARIAGAEPSQAGFFSGWLIRFAYWATKRKVGKVVTPVRVAAHHPKVLWGYAQMEQALGGSKRVDASLKNLVQLRAATLIGCPF